MITGAFGSEMSVKELDNNNNMALTPNDYISSVLITDDDIDYKELGNKTIRDFRKISP